MHSQFILKIYIIIYGWLLTNYGKVYYNNKRIWEHLVVPNMKSEKER